MDEPNLPECTPPHPFDVLLERLSEMQNELALRRWTGDAFERCKQAGAFRERLFDAIAAYRDSYLERR